MSGVNKVILVGNVGADPEIRHINEGVVAKLRVATTERYTNKAGERVEKTEWHSIDFWGKLAETIEKYVRKGSKLYVEGSIHTTSKEDDAGNKRYFTNIRGQRMLMLDSRPESSASSFSEQNTSGTNDKTAPPPVADEADDLPF